MYDAAFKSLPLTLPAPVEPNTRHALHLYTILVDDKRCGVTRDEFLNGMTQHNIGVGVHYMSVPEHPFYQEHFGWRPEDCPNGMRVGRQILSLPMSAKLTDQDVQDVIEAVKRVLNEGRR